MDNNNMDLDAKGTNNPEREASELETISNVANGEATESNLEHLQDDIIRNDTIPETSKNTPGSSGAMPVGAFENSKD